jgi:nicotinamidase-related amidase
MKSALIVVDVQQSFLKRPYWSDADAPRFMERLQALIDRCTARDVPVLQVFHVEEDEGPENPFSRRSGYVKALTGCASSRPRRSRSRSIRPCSPLPPTGRAWTTGCVSAASGI